jgi:hypothetical protein
MAGFSFTRGIFVFGKCGHAPYDEGSSYNDDTSPDADYDNGP